VRGLFDRSSSVSITQHYLVKKHLKSPQHVVDAERGSVGAGAASMPFLMISNPLTERK
jgi:hypothetical protein